MLIPPCSLPVGAPMRGAMAASLTAKQPSAWVSTLPAFSAFKSKRNLISRLPSPTKKIGGIDSFSLGLNPLSSNSSLDLPQPIFGVESATVSFAPQPTQPGTLYQVEWSRDLTAWNLVSGTRSGELLNFNFPTTDKSLFIRYRITLSE
jgi:hypothetical protein